MRSEAKLLRTLGYTRGYGVEFKLARFELSSTPSNRRMW